MATINCAIDSGYGYALGKSSLKNTIISNYILKLTKEQVNQAITDIDELNENNIIIKYDNKYYAFGNLAVKLDRNIKRYSTTMRINNINHTLEIIGTLGLLYNGTSFDANLILGLPNRLRFEKQKFKESLIGKTFSFSYITNKGEVEREITIKNLNVIEQSVAAIFNFPREIMKKYDIISLDIGHGTGDGCVMNEGVLSTNSSDWVSVEGVKWCYSKLKDAILSKYRDEYGMIDIEDIKLQVAIEHNIFRIKGQDLEITDILKDIFIEYADYIIAELDTNYGDFMSRADYIIGSGAIMNNETFTSALKEKLAPYGVEFKRFGDPQKAIVNGMFNIAEQKFEDDINLANSDTEIEKVEIKKEQKKSK